MDDWTPTRETPARRLFQVRAALEVLPYLPLDHRVGMEELASNLERKFIKASTQREKHD